MKKILAIILCVSIIALSLSACSIPFFNKNGGSSNENSNNSGNSQSSDVSNSGSGGSSSGGDNSQNETPTNAAGFVDSQVALNAYTTPADPSNTLNSVADPTSDSMRFVYDEYGRIAKCYYQANGQEVYLVYQYGEAWVQIFGFIGETLVAEQVIQLHGEFNSEIGFSVVNGYYIKGYIF